MSFATCSKCNSPILDHKTFDAADDPNPKIVEVARMAIDLACKCDGANEKGLRERWRRFQEAKVPDAKEKFATAGSGRMA